MATELYANTATTTLAAAIASTGATTCTVVSAALFPVAVAGISQFRAIIDVEEVIVTNVAGTTWTITRGTEGTAAATHLIGATVVANLTAASLLALRTYAGRLFARANYV